MSKRFSVIVADCPWSFSDKLQQSDVKRGAAANYNTMTIEDIKNIDVKSISDPNGAILALWVPSSLLQEGLDVMKSWGFTHKQTYVWVKIKKDPFKDNKLSLKKAVIGAFDFVKDMSVKDIKDCIKDFSTGISNKSYYVNLTNILSFGMGRLFRQTHEVCLIGINNNKIYKQLSNKSQRSVSFGENLKHSAKPEHLQDSLELMFPTSEKIELFARRKRDGWLCLGNEICFNPDGSGEDINTSITKLL